MSIIAPNPPSTLFDPVPWYAHKQRLEDIIEREQDDTVRRILEKALTSTIRTIETIEADPEAHLYIDTQAQMNPPR